nr:MAG TPA: hypothetical protein [Caudoviricetes sp.]
MIVISMYQYRYISTIVYGNGVVESPASMHY